MNTSSTDFLISSLADTITKIIIERLQDVPKLNEEGLRLLILSRCVQDLLEELNEMESYAETISKIPNRRSATYIEETHGQGT